MTYIKTLLALSWNVAISLKYTTSSDLLASYIKGHSSWLLDLVFSRASLFCVT